MTLEEHNNEIELKPYKCDTCGTSYLTNWILQTHIKTMHKLFDEPVVCGIDGCDQQFVSDIKLIEHKKVYHLLNGKYVCDHSKCDYNCGNKELLNIHKKVKHSNKMLFKCQYERCGKAFKLKAQCNNHMKTHWTTVLTSSHESNDNDKEVKTSKNEFTPKKTTLKGMSCNWTECQFVANNNKSLQTHFAEHSNNF